MKNLTERKLRFFLLLLTGVVAVYFACAVYLSAQVVYAPQRDTMLDAARRMQRCMDEIKRLKMERGITINLNEDYHNTGMIGEEYTPITTTLGALNAKRTTANPDMAALCVKLIAESGVKMGDRVGCSFSGSFPAMNIAVVCALDAMGAEAVYTSSIGASTYGANQPALTAPEMLHHLYKRGFIRSDSAAITFGGQGDLGLDMNIAGFPGDEEAFQDMLARYANAGLTITQIEDLQENILWRMRLYGDIDCFVNVGGNVTAVRNVGDAYGYGVLQKPAVMRQKPDDGMVIRYLSDGVPVVHLLNIKALCAENGLPFDPAEQSTPGTAGIYFQVRRSAWLIGFGLCMIAVLLVMLRFTGPLLNYVKNIAPTLARRQEMLLGCLLVGVGVAMPALFTVYNVGVYDSLYLALGENNINYLILAAFQLLMLNILRALPHYIGAFFIADSIIVSHNRLQSALFKLLLFGPLIMLVYQLIQMIYGLRYDFGIPAVTMILFLVVLNIIDFSQVKVLKKALMITFMLATVQALDLMPMISNSTFGNGEAAMDVKQISSFLGADSLLLWLLVFYSILTGISTLLFVILIRDENHIRTVNQQKERSERKLMEVRLAALESRTYAELSHLVHDLKTPLTSIQALVGVIKLQNAKKQTKNLLNNIEVSIEYMSTMISEFLDENKFSRMHANELIEEVLAQISTRPYSKRLRVTLWDGDMDVEVNRIRFCRMLTNLLENSYHAIDPENGVIELRVSGGNVNDRPMACFTVADNGKGMTKEVKTSMFKEGFSLSGSYGIGLGFVKQVVSNHRGIIEVESEVNKGTTITVSIPQDTD